ncbi:S8 family serine peptidase [Streptosporangiaceae bacterium NEAU-GS5]|nr:S8 family serine peptidase [Streptosporangiaceae bacterium NEAU-GS5]
MRMIGTSVAVGALFIGVLMSGGSRDLEVRHVAHSGAAARHDYLVFYADGKRATAFRAIRAAGGTPEDHPKLRYALVRQVATGFPEAAATTPAILGVTPNRAIGAADGAPPPEVVSAAPASATRMDGAAEPLSGRQWDMRLIGASADGSYAINRGSRKVLVGVMDTGVDGTHPDIAPNFNRKLSRSFVRAPHVAGVDIDGHGTHVAGIIGSPVNGLGVAGVAPGVSLVDLRVAVDGTAFYLKPTLDALTYAGDVGIDVVNMSYFIDPWRFNCASRRGDSRADQLEQAGVLVGVQRALDYARGHGVTLVSALGNDHTDLDTVKVDADPLGTHSRKIDKRCLMMPNEAKGVISATAIGPAGKLSTYSNYSLRYADVSAPGGDFPEVQPGDPAEMGAVLAAAPKKMLRLFGQIDAKGKPLTPNVVRECEGGRCSYYQYLAGTSMAAPHVTGVAAILISRFGRPGKGGLTMDPAEVERLLYAGAIPVDCTVPKCRGGKAHNNFYGRGVVNALAAATIEK